MNQHYKIMRYGLHNKYSILWFAPLNALTEEYVKTLYEPLLYSLRSDVTCYIVQMSLFETEDIQAEIKAAVGSLADELAGEKILLSGWCSGGVLALKGAEILEDCGITVKQILMLDTFEPEYIMRVQKEKRLSLDGLLFPAYYIHSFLLQMDSQQPYFKSNQCLRDIHGLRDEDVKDYVYVHLKYLGFSKEMVIRFLYRNIELNLNVDTESAGLLTDIALKKSRRRVTLIKAEREDRDIDDYLGWKNLLGEQISLLQSVYTHDTMLLEGNVAGIAQVIEEILEG